MDTYVMGTDVWEGSLDIDEKVLWDAGVRLIIPRLNSITGDLHKDDNFDAQWAQIERFYRFPYFVYSPWRNGKGNYDFLGEVLPKNVKRVAVDIEVTRQGYSAQAYAADVKDFCQKASKHWNLAIYTGAWFIQTLAYWPLEQEYWYARWPYLFHSRPAVESTWEEMHRKAKIYRWTPAPVINVKVPLQQVSGDSFKLPGMCGRVADVNLFNGDEFGLACWIGTETPKYWAVELTKWARTMGYDGPDYSE